MQAQNYIYTDAQISAIRTILIQGDAREIAGKVRAKLGQHEAVSAGFLIQLAKETDEDEWLAFVRDGEMPDFVSLTAEQMAAVQGGRFIGLFEGIFPLPTYTWFR